jgi:hypothetical protein
MSLSMCSKMTSRCLVMRRLYLLPKSVLLVCNRDNLWIMTIVKIKECHVSNFIQRKYYCV